MTATEQSETITSKTPEIFRLEVVIPVLMLAAFALLPVNLAWGAGLFLVLVHFQLCIALSFDGFIRFSRYRLSQNHPIIDMIVSWLMIAFCFLGFSFVALLMKSYSLAVSPDRKKEEEGKPYYDRPFIVPLVQGVVLLTGIAVAAFRYGG